MPTAYQRQIDTALELISKKGKMIELVRSQTVLIDPVTQETDDTPLTEEVKAVVLPVSSTRRGLNEAALKDLKNSSIRKLLIAAKGMTLVPATSDTFNLGDAEGDDWKVYGLDSLSPDGTPILYSLIVFK